MANINYDHQAKKWHRNQAKIYSDFCGRPEVLKIIQKIGKNKKILDAGCGEGYFTRKISKIAKQIIGVDKSSEMIKIAKQVKTKKVKYYVGNVKKMSFLKKSSFDLYIANCLTNYFHPQELPQFYRELARILKKNGQFILLIPHPALWLISDYGPAIQCQVKNYDYIKSRGKLFKSTLTTITGETLQVGLFHSTFTDHFQSLSKAHLKIKQIQEPVFPKNLAQKYPIFKKMAGKIACMLMWGEK